MKTNTHSLVEPYASRMFELVEKLCSTDFLLRKWISYKIQRLFNRIEYQIMVTKVSNRIV